MEHQYALDMDGRWINAKETPYVEGVEFRCDCPDRHRLKLVKPSGRPGKRVFEDYFAHVAPEPRVSCAGGLCRGGGESAAHRRAKQALRERAGAYDFVAWRCQRCAGEGVVDSAGARVDIEVASSDGRWRYDCLLRRAGGPDVALEVLHTHATGAAKSAGVRALGLEIAEFDAADVMRVLQHGAAPARVRLHNLQVRPVGACVRCVVRDGEAWRADCQAEETHELLRQEARVQGEWHRLMGPEPLMRIPDPTERCQALLLHGVSRLSLRVPELGLLRFRRARRIRGGVAFSGCTRRLPTRRVCALVVDGGAWRGLQRVRSVERVFHVLLDCAEIQCELGLADAGGVTLCDHRVEIMGPEPDPPCLRCGHRGHGRGACRAVVDVLGQPCGDP